MNADSALYVTHAASDYWFIDASAQLTPFRSETTFVIEREDEKREKRKRKKFIGGNECGSPEGDFFFALRQGDWSGFEGALECGEISDKEGWPILLLAASQGQSWPVELLLMPIWGGADPNKGIGTYTPLLAALQKCEREPGNREAQQVVDLLLDHGADPNPQHPMTSPLILAIKAGLPDIASRLLASGADVNFQAEDGETALLAAIRAGESELAGVLMERGARLDVKGPDKKNAVQLALEVYLGQGKDVYEIVLKRLKEVYVRTKEIPCRS